MIEELRKRRPERERAAWAIGHEDPAADALEDLISYLRGFQLGTEKEHKRLLRLVSSLLSAIAPLFDSNTQTPFGRPSEHHAWLEGTAPRLRLAYLDATEFIKGTPQP